MTDNRSYDTISDMLKVGAGDHPAIVVPDGPTVTYESLRLQVSSLSKQLNDCGISRNDRVAIVLGNGIENIVSFLAVTLSGTAAPLNPSYTMDEFKFYLEDTRASALITPTDSFQDAKKSASDKTLLISVSSGTDGNVKFSMNGSVEKPKPSMGITPDDIALVLHTSGTTSRPKRVPITHRNLTASVKNIIATYQLNSIDKSLCIMPLFHVHGLVASLLSTFGSGGTVVIPPSFDALRFWSIVNDYNVTWFTGVPSMHQVLVRRAIRRSRPDSSLHKSLRFIRSCSSPLAPSTAESMETLFGVPVVEAYGMTEASHQMSSNPLPPKTRIPGTVGTSTGVSIEVMDETGCILDKGTTGEIVIRGINVISGYEGNSIANKDSYTNGWFRTGDQGYIDEKGYLTLTGRIKELINRGGEKISPREIDETLLNHPNVAEAVAFGVPSERYGEEVQAAVVLSDNVSQVELKEYCSQHLASFKLPRTIHVVDEIPKTASGKIQRRIVAAKMSDLQQS